jgi:NAD(P)-dependent dehydrogenase (short-subunit alcohol dehydrogenase family)
LSKDAREEIKVNYRGTKNVSDALFPLLRPNARVVNLSSESGALKYFVDRQIAARLSSENLTYEDIDSIIEQYLKYEYNIEFYITLKKNKIQLTWHLFLADISNRAVDKGEGETIFRTTGSYGFTKNLVNALTRIQQRHVDKDQRGIVVSSVNPGYVITDMNKNKGYLTIQQGIFISLFLEITIDL